MFRTLLAVSTALLIASGALGQGTVRGTVSDPTGETIIGASVKVKELPGVFATTDLDGAYSLKLPDANPYTLVITFVTLKTQEKAVSAKGGEVVVVDVGLSEDKTELKAVVVEKKARSTSDVRLERMKINSAASIDYISGEAMLKTGDGDASAAVKRVTGVSTAGAFVTVRGLADRYIVTTINGSRIPTLDPFTNNLKLDLFPTGLLDNIVITKTATPEMTGDWSGALVSLNTSDYPDKFRLSVSTMLGYNPNSTFQDIISAGRNSTDWMGRDDGGRGIPDGVPSVTEDFPRFITPELFQQLTLLGLGPALNAYGITANTSAFQTTAMSSSSQLQHLALVELGLLSPGLINNPTSVQGAVDVYNSTYNLGYFSPIVNSELAGLNKRFDNSRWRLMEVQGNPNFNQSVTIGNQVQVFKKAKNPKTLGFLVGFRYAMDTDYDGSSTFGRTREDESDTNPGDALDFDQSGTQRISTESAGWNALGSLSLKLNRNNSFSLLVMPNVLGQNNARFRVFLKPSVNGSTFGSEDQYYEERKLWVYQFGSKHFFPGTRLRMQTDISYSDGQRNVLDLKTVQYIMPEPGGTIFDVDGALEPPARIYRFLDETLLDARVSFELPLSSDERKARAFKFGGAYRDNTRRNKQTYFTVLGAPGPTQWEEPGRFDMRPDGQFTSLYFPFGTFKDSDIGINRVTSVFGLFDYAVTPRLRIDGGLRAEHTDMITDILRFYEEGVPGFDPSRGTVGDFTVAGGGTAEPKPAVPGIMDQWDLLPSVNIIYKLKDDDIAPTNLRVNWFRSIGRPSFREFSVVQLFDYILAAPVFGNPDLELTNIDNYDLRIERFFQNRNNISLSGFYKRFENHIELLSTLAGGFTWRNADFSHVYGLELEGRIGIAKGLDWRGNLTLMESRSDLTFQLDGEEVAYSTQMFGQAPYIVNSMLSWASDSARFNASISYNVQGPKLVISNSELAPRAVRAYEMPRHMIDVTLSKSFGKHWGVRARVRNLLNAPLRRAYKFDKGYDFDFDVYTYGTEYNLTLSYTIK